MKKTLPLGLLLTLAAIPFASADISITSAGSTAIDFATVPSGLDFASVSVAGGAGDLAALGTATAAPIGIDRATNGVSATLAWPATATDWAVNTLTPLPTATQSLSANVRHVTPAASGCMITGATGNRYHALLARFQNDSPAAITSLTLNWNLGSPVPSAGTGAVGTDALAGLHVYSSRTGLVGSWTRVQAAPFQTIGAQSTTLALAVPAGEDVYFAWIDDNGPASGTAPNLEGNYTVDDVAIVLPTALDATVTNVVRNDPNTTPTIASDDTVSFTLNVAGQGALVSPTWGITAPASLMAESGAYNVPKVITVPITDFAANHTLTISINDPGGTLTDTVTVTAPWGVLTPTLNNFVLNTGASPTDEADDIFTFDASSTAVFASSQVTIATGTNDPVTVDYGTAANQTPTVTPVDVVFTDVADPTITTTSVLHTPKAIGQSNLGASTSLIYSQPFVGPRAWTIANQTSTQTAATQVNHVVLSDVIDLRAEGGVKITATLVATPAAALTGSGFEAGDFFRFDAIVNEDTATPISMLGDYDTTVPKDGRLSGGTLAVAELPDQDSDPGSITPKTYNFVYVLPASADSVQLSYTGNSNSTGETLVLSNVLVEPADATILTQTGAVTLNNGGTVDPADDRISAPVTITPVSIGASLGWTSDADAADEHLPASGTYAAAQPIIFSSLASASPAVITLIDNEVSTVTRTVTLARPAQTLAVTLVAGSILRNENGAGTADDSVTFRVTMAPGNVGPEFRVAGNGLRPLNITGAGAYPATTTEEVTITITNLPNGGVTVPVIFSDASYPTAPAPVTINVAIPAPAVAIPAVFGQKDLGGGLTDLLPATTPAPSALWVNYAGIRSYVMTAGVAADSIVESETLDLTSVPAVNFSMTFRANENSATSNFETADRFKADLIIDGQTVPLITPTLDVGRGDSATVDPGTNGPSNFYLNGYTGTLNSVDFRNQLITYATADVDYDANRERDELNSLGSNAATFMDSSFTLSHTIPASANNVKLVIYGQSAAGSEAFTVKDVLFQAVASVDTDMDGMDDAYETANGLNPAVNDSATDLDGDGRSNLAEFIAGTAANDPASALKVATIAAGSTAGQYIVTWTSVPGKRYQIQESTDLGAGDTWTDVGGVISASAGTTTSSPAVSLAGVRDFVRVKVVP